MDGAVEHKTGSDPRLAEGLRVLLILASLAAAVLLIGALRNVEILPIKRIFIEGELLQLDKSDLQKRVIGEVGGGFFGVDVDAVRDSLIAIPWIEEASVRRVWPDALKVVVDEQTPAARWNDAGLLNTRGDYFAPQRSLPPLNLPRLEGPEEERVAVLEKFDLLTRSYGLDVSHLRLTGRRSWSLELHGGLRVVIGRVAFEERVARLIEVVLPHLGESLAGVEEIDMRYPNGFAVRWRERQEPTNGGQRG